MVLNEIVRTCSNVHMANAVLASVGGAFASRFAAKASHCKPSPGMLASLVVQEYSAHASPAQRVDVRLTARARISLFFRASTTFSRNP